MRCTLQIAYSGLSNFYAKGDYFKQALRIAFTLACCTWLLHLAPHLALILGPTF